MNGTVIKGMILVCLLIVAVIIMHKYGAELLTGLGAAALAKSLLGSNFIAAPGKGSTAEKAIAEEAAADGEVLTESGEIMTGEAAAAAGEATATIAGEAALTGGAEAAAAGAGEIAGEGILATVAEDLGVILLAL